MISDLQHLFLRDIDRLSAEVKAFGSDDELWVEHHGIKNTGGTLVLHLCGNLRHFVGHVIGGSDYQRQREEEFSTRNVSKALLLEEIAKTRNEVDEALSAMDAQLLVATYPIQVFDTPMNYRTFLFHLLSHLNYHLGQMNYYRRQSH